MQLEKVSAAEVKLAVFALYLHQSRDSKFHHFLPQTASLMEKSNYRGTYPGLEV